METCRRLARSPRFFASLRWSMCVACESVIQRGIRLGIHTGLMVAGRLRVVVVRATSFICTTMCLSFLRMRRAQECPTLFSDLLRIGDKPLHIRCKRLYCFCAFVSAIWHIITLVYIGLICLDDFHYIPQPHIAKCNRGFIIVILGPFTIARQTKEICFG